MDKLQYDSEIAKLYMKAVPIEEIKEITGATGKYIKSVITKDMSHVRMIYQKRAYRKRTGKKQKRPAKTYREAQHAQKEATRKWNLHMLENIKIEAPYVIKMMRYERGCIAAEGMKRFPSFVDIIRLWQSCGGSTTSDFVNEDDFRESIVHGRVINGMEYKAGEFTIERHTNDIPQYYDLLR